MFTYLKMQLAIKLQLPPYRKTPRRQQSPHYRRAHGEKT